MAFPPGEAGQIRCSYRIDAVAYKKCLEMCKARIRAARDPESGFVGRPGARSQMAIASTEGAWWIW